MTSSDDRLLVARIKQGNQEAYVELVNKHRGKAFAIAYNFVRNTEDAKEISQDAFLRVYRSIDKFKEESSFSTWFYRIIINLCGDFKKKKRIKTVQFSQYDRNDDFKEDGIETMEDKKASNPLNDLLSVELNDKIENVIDQLSKQQKSVFVLRHFEGFTLNEIAKILDCKEGTVKSHLFRSVEKLKDLLKSTV